MIDHDLLRTQAREALPADVFAYFAAGSGAEVTLAGQGRAWDDALLRPRVLRDVSTTSTTTQVLGQELAQPVLVAPMAAQCLVHPDGEVAVARAARATGGLMVLSMRSSTRLEDVAAAGPFWQQIYVLRDRGVSDEVAIRAATAGARALVVTVDTPYVARKRAGFPADMPERGLIEALDGHDGTNPALLQAPDLVTARHRAPRRASPACRSSPRECSPPRPLVTAWPPAPAPWSSRPMAGVSSTESSRHRWRWRKSPRRSGARSRSTSTEVCARARTS